MIFTDPILYFDGSPAEPSQLNQYEFFIGPSNTLRESVWRPGFFHFVYPVSYSLERGLNGYYFYYLNLFQTLVHPWYSSFTGFSFDQSIWFDIKNGFIYSDWYLIFQDFSDSRFIYKGIFLLLDFFSNFFYYGYFDWDLCSLILGIYFLNWYIRFCCYGLNILKISRFDFFFKKSFFYSNLFLIFNKYISSVFLNFKGHKKDFFVRTFNYFSLKKRVIEQIYKKFF